MNTRRDFLKGTSLALVASQLFPCVGDASSPGFVLNHVDHYLIGGLTLNGKTMSPEIVKRSVDQQHFLLAINERTQASIKVRVPFALHSVILHPKKERTVIGIPNDAILSEAVEVDLSAGAVTKRIGSAKGHGFYGHGLSLSMGAVVVFVEYESDMKTAVSIRDSVTYKEVERFTEFGSNPHAISMASAEESNVALVCFPEYLAMVSLKTGKIQRKFFSADQSQRLSHIEINPSDGPFVLANVASGFDRTSVNGKIFKCNLSDELLVPLNYHASFPGEALSSAVDSKNKIMLVTHQDCDKVSLWDLKSSKMLRSEVTPPRPRGAVFDPVSGNFLFSTIEANMMALNRSGPARRAGALAPNSSHFIRVSFPT